MSDNDRTAPTSTLGAVLGSAARIVKPAKKAAPDTAGDAAEALPTKKPVDESNASKAYQSQQYWKSRSDLVYYNYIEFMVRTLGGKAERMLDVGTGNCPYIEWFDWIPTRISVDIRVPYSSERVQGIKGDIFKLDLGPKFDIVTCLQVLEHIPDAKAFARRLLELGRTVIVSVPHRWPANPPTPGHVQDPVDYEKLTGWMGREANYQIIVQEPFLGQKGQRLIAVYDEDPTRVFGSAEVRQRRPR